jgi:hypothetical protein
MKSLKRTRRDRAKEGNDSISNSVEPTVVLSEVSGLDNTGEQALAVDPEVPNEEIHPSVDRASLESRDSEAPLDETSDDESVADNIENEERTKKMTRRFGSCFKCTKEGKMLILCECSTGDTASLRWIAGPYWNMLLLTYLILIIITALIYGAVVPEQTFESVFGITLSCIVLLLLTLTAFRDPGVFPKHTRPLVGVRYIILCRKSYFILVNALLS